MISTVPMPASLLLPGSKIWWEMHYHAVGEALTDHVELAVYLYPKGKSRSTGRGLMLFSGIPNAARGLDIAPNSISNDHRVSMC